MEMTEEEYKSRLAREKFPQAYQLGKIDENKGIIEEKRKGRAIQKKKMIIGAISLVVAILSLILYYIKNFY